MGKCVAVFGTASNTGKTTLTAAMCRVFSDMGRRVFPFKAFNLSANSFDYGGLTIGAAQFIQAAACRRDYDPRMNPVFKMYGGGHMRCFIHGVERDLSGVDETAFIRETSSAAFVSALRENDLVIVEGSGSCCELNLKRDDVANMYFALRHNIPVIVVGSIENGGIFGSLYGTLSLLPDRERRLVKGVAVNRFYGDLAQFEEGRALIEQTCGVKLVTVMPDVKLNLPEEDGASRTRPADTNQDINREILLAELDALAEAFMRHADIGFLEKVVEEGVKAE